jgi:cytochrome c oxidase assembly factor CtaG
VHSPPLLTPWSFEPLQIVPTVLVAVLYLRRTRTLARRGQPVPLGRRIAFWTGIALTVLALNSPIDALGEEHFFFLHMLQHVLIGDLAPLCFVVGLTGPVLRPVLALPVVDRLRVLAHPLVALPLWAVDLYVWHLPIFYEAALRNSGVHALEHAMFLAFGVNMWMCLFGPLPMPQWFGNLGRLFYIVAVRLTGTVLGNVFLWSGSVLYPYYRHGDAVAHIGPVTDQNLAGAIMMVEESLLTLGLFCWLFLRAARESEERQDLLDLAAARGVELTETRAARAVAAGRGAELRRRLEAGRTTAEPPAAAGH